MEYDPNGLEWLLRTFDRMHHNFIRTELTKRGLGMASHPAILFMLRDEIAEMTASQKEIADLVGISAPTVAISLKRMEKAGLVRKITDQQDLRRNRITITPKALQLLEECQSTFDAVDQAVFAGLSARDQEQLKAYYLRMIHNLEAMGAQLPDRFKRRQPQ